MSIGRALLRVLAGVTLLSASACQEPQPLEVRSGCETPEVVECLQKYAYKKMQPSDIRHLLMTGRHECFARERDLVDEQGQCLPLVIGRDARFDEPLVLYYVCDDLCTGQVDSIWLRYASHVSVEECCDRNGLPVRRWSTGGTYAGCAPPEYSAVFEGDDWDSYSLCEQ